MVSGQRYIDFIAPGIIAGYVMFSASFECTYGSFVRMEYQKTYDAIISTPLSVEDVIAGEISWGTTRAMITGISILIVIACFQLVVSPWALLIPLLVLIEGLMFASMAMFFTSLVPTIYSFNYYYTLFITPMFLFSGVFFPISSFPRVIQVLSWIAPLTPAAKLSRALISGQFSIELLWALMLIILLIVVFFYLSLVLMRRRLIQ